MLPHCFAARTKRAQKEEERRGRRAHSLSSPTTTQAGRQAHTMPFEGRPRPVDRGRRGKEGCALRAQRAALITALLLLQARFTLFTLRYIHARPPRARHLSSSVCLSFRPRPSSICCIDRCDAMIRSCRRAIIFRRRPITLSIFANFPLCGRVHSTRPRPPPSLSLPGRGRGRLVRIPGGHL